MRYRAVRNEGNKVVELGTYSTRDEAVSAIMRDQTKLSYDGYPAGVFKHEIIEEPEK